MAKRFVMSFHHFSKAPSDLLSKFCHYMPKPNTTKLKNTIMDIAFSHMQMRKVLLKAQKKISKDS